MKKIKCFNILEFSNTKRNYFNCEDIRISDVYIYNKDDVHLYHSHNKVTELLYVLDGIIIVKIKKNGEIEEFKIKKDNIAIISAKEKHTVASITDTARVLVFKYLKTDKDLLTIFLNDFQDE